MNAGLRVVIQPIEGSKGRYGAMLPGAPAGDRRLAMRVFDLNDLARDLGFAPAGLADGLHAEHLNGVYSENTATPGSVPRGMLEIGRWLSNALFPAGSLWTNTAIASANMSHGPLDLLLELDPSVSDLPWELLHVDGLALPPCVVRSVGTSLGAPHDGNIPLDPAVVFLACRRVDGYEDLSDVVDKELENLRDIIGQRAEIIEVGNFRDFSDLLTDQKAAERLVGLHFIGHGDLAERRPFLTCPQDAGGAQLYRIYPQTLLQLLLQYRPSPLLWVFLEACRAGADDVSLAYPTGGFAASLSKLGVANCALAMRFEITSRFATTFSGSFYRNYIAGDRTTVPVAYRLARSQMSGFAEFSTELAAVSLFVNEVGEKISALGPRQQTKHKTDDLSMRSYAESLDGHTSSSDRLARAHLDTSAAGHVSNRSTVAQSPTRSGELNSVSGTRDRLVQIMSAHRWNSKEADELIDDITRALGATTEVDVRGSLTRQLSLIRMVRVPDGFYDIGYTDEHIQRITGALARKFPRQVVAQVRELLEKVKPRKIYVPALLVDRFPVTRDDFRRFVEIESYVTTAEATGSSVTWKTFASSDSASFPVVGVSYRDAQRYAQWAGKRLPTAEEWQVLVRCNDSRIYPWGWPFGEERCNTAESLAGQERSQVDRFHEGVDEWGCYDLVGNVEEWTSTADTRDPDAYRICGGSWKMTCEVFGLSGVYRTGGDSVFTDDLGFRCCRNETLDDSALFS